MSFGNKTYKGRFTPSNPGKYIGDIGNIIFRSSWELKVLNELDRNPAVIEYASEEISIPYVSPVDRRVHRYFPDFFVKLRTTEGIKNMLLEVKPAIQTCPPKQPKKMTRRFITEAATYSVNDAKWKAARAFCDQQGWDFRVVTEKEIFSK
jgi:hypothetical protein